jgi:hypothetical protein
MSSKDKPGKRRERMEDDEETLVDVPNHRPRVDHDEQREYEEWRKERGERGRKRRGHREREHHRKDEDDL